VSKVGKDHEMKVPSAVADDDVLEAKRTLASLLDLSVLASLLQLDETKETRMNEAFEDILCATFDRTDEQTG
jgi:hypothetical protein